MCNCTLAKIPKEELKDFKKNYAKAMNYIAEGLVPGPLDKRANDLYLHIKGKLDAPLDRFIGLCYGVKDRNFDERLEQALREGERQEGTEPLCALTYATDLLRSFNGKHT
jgi:hypothetical protein